MSNSSRVFITGMSALTASGTTIEENWHSIIEGTQSIDEIQGWDLSNWDSPLGGQLKEFKPAKMLPDKKLFKVISKQDVMGINAAVQAINQSGFIPYRDSQDQVDTFNNETAVFVGSPGNKYFQQYDFLPLLSKSSTDMKTFATELFSEVHPMWLLRILPNNVLAYTGITYGFKGINHNITNHAVSGAQALIEAFYAIQSGQAERAVVVAYDLGVEPQALFYYNKLGVISNDDLMPFDQRHNGTILADGAAAIVLESENSVKKRDAYCYSEMIGGLSATEGTGLFTIDDEGRPLSDLFATILKRCQINPGDIGMIVAHGNGNEKSDDSEATAISSLFPSQTPITAFKWSMGHTLCASGIVDSALASYALNERCIPGIANFQSAAVSAKNLSISSAQQPLNRSPYALIINRGFGSMNACIVMKACE